MKQLQQEEDDDSDQLTDSQKKRLIMQSLMRPAADIVYNIQGTSEEILQILDTVYGSVIEGHELLLQFYMTYQSEKELCSEYVQRLYMMAIDVAEHKGITMVEIPKQLLQQLIRGSHTESLIQKLNMEDNIDNPPTFANLLLDIRKEEAKQAQKRLRLKPSAKVAMVTVDAKHDHEDTSDLDHDRAGRPNLEERVVYLEAQLQQRQMPPTAPSSDSGFSTFKQTRDEFHSSTGRRGGKQKQHTGQKGFCYQCGEDGHHAPACSKPPNAILVQQKLLKRYASLNH